MAELQVQISLMHSNSYGYKASFLVLRYATGTEAPVSGRIFTRRFVGCFVVLTVLVERRSFHEDSANKTIDFEFEITSIPPVAGMSYTVLPLSHLVGTSAAGSPPRGVFPGTGHSVPHDLKSRSTLAKIL